MVDNNKPKEDNKTENKNKDYYDEHGLPKYEELVKYENEIRKEVEENTPLVSSELPIDMLISEFVESQYTQMVPEIVKRYTSMRTIRRDGNCFYRAYLFRLFEEIADKKDQKLYESVMKIVKDSKDLTERQGYQWLVIEDFYNLFIKELELIYALDFLDSTQYLAKLFDDKERGNYLIVFIRLFIAAYIKENRILYEAFIVDEFDHWVLKEVEALDNECDQVQIMAVVNAFNIGVKIEYLNPNMVETIQFPEEGQGIFINMLFRPGHYDVLYIKK